MEAKIGKRLLATLKPQDRPFEVNDTELKGFILRVQPSGMMTYYAAYRTLDGRRNRKKIGRHGGVAEKGVFTADKARDAAKKILADATKGIDPKEAQRAAKASTLKEYLEEEYGPWVEANRKTGKATLARLKAAFPDLLPKKPHEITPWLIDKWRSARVKNGVKEATVNRDIVALKAALSKAVEWKILKSNPIAEVKPKRIDPSPNIRYLTPAEEIRLREALQVRDDRAKTDRATANAWRKTRGYPLFPDLSSLTYPDHLHPLVIISLNTGLRRGELFSLCWENVDLKKKLLTVVAETAKNSKTRHVPLNLEAHQVLKAWKKQGTGEGLVFPGKDGKRLDNVKKAWGNLLDDAGIVNFRWHDMRHHFASMLVMAGIDLNTVRDLLGHADIKMTLRYAHLAPEHRAAAVAVLDNPRRVARLVNKN